MVRILWALWCKFLSWTHGRQPCTPRSRLPSTTMSESWTSCRQPPSVSPRRQRKVVMVNFLTPIPLRSPPSPLGLLPSPLGLTLTPRSAMLRSARRGLNWGNAPRASSPSESAPPPSGGHAAAKASASPRAELRAVDQHQSGAGCLRWVVPYVPTALYRVVGRWCWAVVQSEVVPPQGVIFVGMAPKALRAPLVAPKRCLGRGRGPTPLPR